MDWNLQHVASMIIVLVIPVGEADNARDREVKVKLAGLPL